MLFANFIPFVVHNVLPPAFKWLWFTAPIWIPIVCITAAWDLWVHYRRRRWILAQDKIVLEIKLPLETFKTPAAMELFFTALYQTFGETTPITRYIDGVVRPWFSLELVSIDGEFHFYIWTFKNGKMNIESNIYAQFPDAEVHEVEDYTKNIFFDHETHKMFASEFTLSKSSAYPIKTYIDFGMDKMTETEEPYKIDPMASLFESLGALKKGEQLWIQIMIRAHKKEKTIFNNDKEDHWKKEAEEEIKKIIATTEVADADGNKAPNQLKLTKGQQETINALERSITKFSFDTGIRGIYIATKEAWNQGHVGSVLGAFRQYTGSMNGFKPDHVPGFDYPWQDFRDIRTNAQKHHMFKYYRMRGFFYGPVHRTPCVLNTEELATIYHFPGSVVRTPSLKRIPSKRADAPANLPI